MTLLTLLALGCDVENTVSRRTYEDVFLQEPASQVDALWVVDDSVSMAANQARVAESLAGFVEALEATHIDFHLGVVTTDMDLENPDAAALIGDPPYITPEDDYLAMFQERVLVGIEGSPMEKGIQAAVDAVNEPMASGRNAGFLRDDSVISIFFVSDEEDQSGNNPVSRNEFRDWMETLKPRPEDVIAHSIVELPGTQCASGDTPGAEYVRYANWTDGVTEDICAPDWEPALQEMFDLLLDTARVVVPDPVESIEQVSFSGPAGDRVLDASEYTFDVDANTVYFDRGVRPAADEVARVEYLQAN